MLRSNQQFIGQRWRSEHAISVADCLALVLAMTNLKAPSGSRPPRQFQRTGFNKRTRNARSSSRSNSAHYARSNLSAVLRTVIGVMGGGENATVQAMVWAQRLGTLIAAEGWVLLSGGRNAGVMNAVSIGAKQAGGLVIGILPKSDTKEVSEAVDIAIVTGMGSARNNINVLSSDVVIACGNAEAGTLSEIALTVKAEKPVVLLTEDDEARRFLERIGCGLLHTADSPEAAIALTRQFLS